MAKSIVRTFVYAKADGTVGTRTVFVMNESSKYLRGLDFAYLDANEQREVQEKLHGHEIGNEVSFGKSAKPLDNFNESWSKAWRTFNKENIR